MKPRIQTLKRSALSALALATICLSSAAPAQRQDDRNTGLDTTHRDRARVTRVEQINRRGDSYRPQECWNEGSNRHEGGYYRDDDGRLYYDGGYSDGRSREGDSRKSSNTGGTIVGALVGGALGNQVGKGDGRTAATIVGALIGAGIGKHTGDGYDRYRNDSGVELRCRTIADDDYRRRYGEQHYPDSDLYRVTYTYGGQSYQSMSYDRPGRYVSVLVDVQLQD